MHNNFCTLFDKNYLARGLALYYSLKKYFPGAVLWIMCNDEETYGTLNEMDLPDVRLLKMSDVEDQKMLAVKPSRNVAEYCWMFSSALPLYILESNPQLPSISYLDADLYFYDSPKTIFDQFGSHSIMLIPHGYSEKNRHRQKTSGKFNVGMMIFRNDQNGLECLRWWKERCIEWCFDYYENGKYGDQLYLDDWENRFKGVFVLQEPGANVAPWNIGRFHFARNKNDRITAVEKSTNKTFPLIFFHFHGLKIYCSKKGAVKAYPITVYNKLIYVEYMNGLNMAYEKIRKTKGTWNYGCEKKLDILRHIKQSLTILLQRR